jgi:hypothetical protein
LNLRKNCLLTGIIGVLDGTHIRIPAPPENQNSYINRKKFHSMNVMLIYEHTLKFTDVYAGEAGSVHDACVFRRSPLQVAVASNQITIPSDKHLIGDTAYPLLKHLMVGFKDNGHLTEQQKRFNRAVSGIRSDIERAIGMFKLRFRRFKCLEMYKLSEIPKVIVAGAILHNLCMSNEDYLFDDDDDDDDDDDSVDDSDSDGDETLELEEAAPVSARQKRENLIAMF